MEMRFGGAGVFVTARITFVAPVITAVFTPVP
jgi:hypothetical protein